MWLGIPDDYIATCCHDMKLPWPLAEARLFWYLKTLSSYESVPGVGVQAPYHGLNERRAHSGETMTCLPREQLF
jgi:hypothetical protein